MTKLARRFLKYCSLTATSLGLGPAFVPQIAHAMETKPRTPALWLVTEHDCALVRLRLHDNGPGIQAEHLSRIFDPFLTTKPVGKGTGLGLSFSYGIVEQHGGELRAGNHPDGGAESVLEMPFAG